ARRVAGEEALVAGAMGPLGVRMEPFGPTARDEVRAVYREQARGLLEGGVDFFILETFSFADELIEAIRGAREAGDLPVVAQMTVGLDLHTAFGTDPESFVPRIVAEEVQALGLNCSVGPHALLQALERIRPLTALPLSAQPNGGLPRDVEGRKIYVASPEYMAEYAGRLVKAGAKLIGGCCGTGPAHIRKMAGAIRALHPTPHREVAVRVPSRDNAPVEVVPLVERSRLGRKIRVGEPVVTVEIVPPRGADPGEMLAQVAELKKAGVDAVNVPDGPRAQMKMGALATAFLIQDRTGLEALVHYTCRDRNLLGMLSDLLGAHALGLRNLLLITGDPPRMGPYPDATAVFDVDSIGLTNLVDYLNHGMDPGGNPIGSPTAFVKGVGVNPGAEDMERELQRFYWKVDAGAEFAITQPVFDPGRLESFLLELDRRSLRIPVVAGIWPLVSLRNAEFLANEVPGIQVPRGTLDRMRRASERGGDHAVHEGIAMARESWEALRGEVQGIQVNAPFGKVHLAAAVLRDLPGLDSGGVASGEMRGGMREEAMAMGMMRPGPAGRDFTGSRGG
ncbi:MAG: bifunctional homocysteine S-methyltransferase/methylenetetrahydrofolate reductase, partial [Longimicrobiales bacterium]